MLPRQNLLNNIENNRETKWSCRYLHNIKKKKSLLNHPKEIFTSLKICIHLFINEYVSKIFKINYTCIDMQHTQINKQTNKKRK